jgi:threonine dehydrogenase-like Zn-dependent dehydrogenase
VRFEERETPKIMKPTDAIIRISATCVCGSDLWPYCGIQPIAQPTPMGHEYFGIVEEVGSGVTSIKPGRGDEGVQRIKELTKGVGAGSVLECVGTQESMVQAIQSTRRGGHVGYVGVPHGVELNGEQLFYAHVHLHGGPAPVRRYLPELIKLVWNSKDQSRQGVRPDPASRSGGRGLPRNGPVPCNQDAATPDTMIGTTHAPR